MGKPTGFLEYERHPMPSRPPGVRVNDYFEIYERADEGTLREQGARCMDCGIPFCQSETGCPIDNLIPEWNDLVFHGRWRDAYERLALTNNFPEFTGRICPAPCESACVLGINEPPVTIKSVECTIIDRAFEEGWVQPNTPAQRTGKKVAIVGSGPAGLAAADQLNKVGHSVTVFERDDRIGGLLMYGVPNMKLEKSIVQRRVDLLRDAGIEFRTRCSVGGDPAHHGSSADAEHIPVDTLLDDYDAVLLACGALRGRDLSSLPGWGLDGVHMAMEFLYQSTRSLLDSALRDGQYISAKDKHVVVIGAGDTGTDCIGTALRHGCRSVLNITRRQREPEMRDEYHPWPGEPGTFYIDYGHAEASARFDRDPREHQVQPIAFLDLDGDGRVDHIRIARLDWSSANGDGRQTSTQVEGSEEDLPADLVLVAAGFTGPDTPSLLDRLGVETDRHGAVRADYGRFETTRPGVFAAGDVRRGASLIVWAIAEGRGAARAIDHHLTGSSTLPAPGIPTQLLSSAG